MEKDFKRYMGKKVQIVGGGDTVAESLKDYLERHPKLEKLLTKNEKRVYMTTDDPVKFKKMGEKFLGHTIPKVERCSL